MAKFVKVILFLLLTVVLHGVASNVLTEKVEQKQYVTVLAVERQTEVGVPEYPYLPVAELIGNSSFHQMTTTRVQRVQIGDYFFSLKSVLQNYANRENSLSQHWGRIYSTTTSYNCQPASEYYVFALRRIII